MSHANTGRVRPLVIHTYRTACATVAQPPGFGDFLRGSAALCQLSEQYGFELQIDFSHHPLKEYLEQIDCVNTESDSDVHEFFNQANPLLEPFLSSLPDGARAWVTTHCVPVSSLGAGCKKFLKKRLVPQQAVMAILKDISAQLGENYCAVHVRMGDHAIGAACPSVPVVDAWFRDVVMPEWGSRVLVFSDNSAIKEYLAMRFGVMFIPNTPVHLGQCGSITAPRDGVRDAVIDFFVLARARKIYQYSVYPWGSGFSDMCARIYGIPLVKISSQASGI